MSELEILPKSLTSRHRLADEPPSDGAGGRNFFIFLDGTWNEERCADGSSTLSNVRRLYNCLAEDSEQQIARYFRGVGNDQDNGWLKRRLWGFNGSEERSIRKAAYATINREYRRGDRLFIFGFSRGAACARRLAADLAGNGIYPEIDVKRDYKANRLTQQVETRIRDYSVRGEPLSVEIAFLGCWDTVGAFVLPLRLPRFRWLDGCIRRWVRLRQRLKGDVPFSDLKVASNVRRAVHCVAIDETRDAFLPTLMAPDERIEEVWFPGVHADVGGGYVRDGLSRIALKFMIGRLEDCVRDNGYRPILWDLATKDRYAELPDELEYDFHFHGLTRWFRLYGKSIRMIRVRDSEAETMEVKPRIHHSVAHLWQSDRVYAGNSKGKRWRIDYRPYNITELNRTKDLLEIPEDEWPFEWAHD